MQCHTNHWTVIDDSLLIKLLIQMIDENYHNFDNIFSYLAFCHLASICGDPLIYTTK